MVSKLEFNPETIEHASTCAALVVSRIHSPSIDSRSEFSNLRSEGANLRSMRVNLRFGAQGKGIFGS